MLYENLFERIMAVVQGCKVNEDTGVGDADNWVSIVKDVEKSGPTGEKLKTTQFYLNPKTNEWKIVVLVDGKEKSRVISADDMVAAVGEESAKELIDMAMKRMGDNTSESKVDEAGEGKTFILKVSMDNDAFVDDPARELARVLRNAADQVIHGEMNVDAGDSKNLKDVNGNTVGEMRIVVGPSSTKYED